MRLRTLVGFILACALIGTTLEPKPTEHAVNEAQWRQTAGQMTCAEWLDLEVGPQGQLAGSLVSDRYRFAVDRADVFVACTAGVYADGRHICSKASGLRDAVACAQRAVAARSR